MKKNNVVPMWVSAVLLILCAVNLIGVGMMLMNTNQIQTTINSVLCIIAVVLAIVYCFMGYKKSAARYFKYFSIALLLLVLLQVNHYAVMSQSMGTVAPEGLDSNFVRSGLSSDAFLISLKITVPILIFAMLFTLTIAKDLGKKKSYWLCSLSFVLSLVNLITALVNTLNAKNASDLTFALINSGYCIEFSIFTLCAIYGVMVYAKYADKEARGTK